MADALARDAVAALNNAIVGILPPAPSGVTRALHITPRRVRPLGLGGYIGIQQEPQASQYGRRVQAQVSFDISAGSDAATRDQIALLASDLLTLSRNELRAAGILKLDRCPPEGEHSLAFDVDFEFISVTTTGEGLITDLVLDIEP